MPCHKLNQAFSFRFVGVLELTLLQEIKQEVGVLQFNFVLVAILYLAVQKVTLFTTLVPDLSHMPQTSRPENSHNSVRTHYVTDCVMLGSKGTDSSIFKILSSI